MDAFSNISYKAFEAYEVCPRKFLWTYGWAEVDVGNGPGLPKARVNPFRRPRDLETYAFAKAVAAFYANEVWLLGPQARERFPRLVARAVDDLLQHPQVRSAQSRLSVDAESLHASTAEMCVGWFETFKHHRLLGHVNTPFAPLSGQLNQWMTIEATVPLLLRRNDAPAVLLKLSADRKKRIDDDAARWDALAFWRGYRTMPGRIGYLWGRYPYGQESLDLSTGEVITEPGITWIPFDKEDLEGLWKRAVAAREGMRRREFGPQAVPEHCRECPFEPMCDKRQEQKSRRRSARKRPLTTTLPAELLE